MKSGDLKAFDPIALGRVAPIDLRCKRMRFFLERCSGKRVLDVGCASHLEDHFNSPYFLHRALGEVTGELLGVDLNDVGVRNLNAKGYNAIVGDVENLTIDRKFDVVVAGDIIEHLGNLEGFLKSCLNALEPDGTILVYSPNPWYWRNVVKAALYPEVPNNPEHTCWFDPRTFRQLVERYGLTLGAVEFSSRFLRDRLMPLPRGLRHTSWGAEVLRRS